MKIVAILLMLIAVALAGCGERGPKPKTDAVVHLGTPDPGVVPRA